MIFEELSALPSGRLCSSKAHAASILLMKSCIFELRRMVLSDAGYRRAAFILLAVGLSAGLEPQASTPKSQGVNADAVVIGDFEKQTKDYVRLHKKAEAGLPPPKPTASPHMINEHRRMLATRIQTARQQATQGDLFSPQVSKVFKRLIAIAYQDAGPAKVGSSLQHDEPVHGVKVRVNAIYPETIPLQTTPSSILVNLPPLPPELDYRIVGRDLVLRDTGANLIVDYIPDAIPQA